MTIAFLKSDRPDGPAASDPFGDDPIVRRGRNPDGTPDEPIVANVLARRGAAGRAKAILAIVVTPSK